MHNPIFESTQRAYITPVPNDMSKSFDLLTGDLFMVSFASSPKWVEKGNAEQVLTYTLRATGEGPVAVSVLEMRKGNCFIYVIADPSEPAFWPTFAMWSKKGGFATHLDMGERGNVGECSLSEKNVRAFGIHPDKRGNPNPQGFAELVDVMLAGGVLSECAKQTLLAEGVAGDVVPTVEVNILSPTTPSWFAPVNGRFPRHEGQLSTNTDEAGAASPLESSINDTDSAPGKFAVRMLEFGTLENAKAYARISKSAAKMKSSTPVLSSNIDFERFMKHSSIRGVFGFGDFRMDDRIILTMRLQSGRVQIYWLADSTDPEVWQAIARWEAAGEAGFALAEGANALFIPWKLTPTERRIRQHIGERGKKKETEFIDVASRLVDSGMVHRGATSDIEGLSLEYVHVNVLMTKRLQRAANAVLVGQPTTGDSRQAPVRPEWSRPQSSVR
jgi:hypothetical protein